MNEAAADASRPLELSIVIPCLNEAETLGAVVLEAQAFLKEYGIGGEVVVSDNGSTDGSQEIACAGGARLVHAPMRGYGAALFYGTQACRGRYIIMGDADGSHDFPNLMPFVEKLREGYDLVMGNRFRGGIDKGAMSWKNRYLGNPILSGIGRLFFHCRARDFHCGLRGFTRETFDRLDLRTTGMEYASEMIIKATLYRMKIAEVPTQMHPDGRSRPPHLRPWRDGWRHLRFMLLYSPRWLFLYPGSALMFVGLVILLWLLPGPRSLGGLTFDLHTLLFGAFVALVGFQAVVFSGFSKIFAIQAGLLPPDPRMDRLFRVFKLETGLLVGAVLLLAGLGGSAYTIGVWATKYFGNLEPTQFVRQIVFWGVLLSLGCQIILASFFLSVMGLSVRRLKGNSQ
jgi:glycosyltransferase involved in cell wall biosynthesis